MEDMFHCLLLFVSIFRTSAHLPNRCMRTLAYLYACGCLCEFALHYVRWSFGLVILFSAILAMLCHAVRLLASHISFLCGVLDP